MARVQQVKEQNKKTAVNNKNNTAKSKAELAKTNPKREATKNEILFFRLGMSIIALTLITVAIIFTIRYFMNNDEEVVVYEDLIHITTNDLKYLTYDDGSGVYGDFAYFNGLADKEDLAEVINTNNLIYVYFYRSSKINEEIQTIIEGLDLEGKAFLLLDLDKNTNVFDLTEKGDFTLDNTRDNMLLIFNVEAQTFQLEIRVVDIVREINKL
ncbi:MAG: hypothetical protein CVV57_05330 [Tenericutes bacterium HGW-Tenericutes-2]|jgi:hypothetical protein|nr:MAG: hypothetical protein CVV57_05330 [Tenericutes bacterium HGW-Tenericutes-2]